MTFTEGGDHLTVEKAAASDWVELRTVVNHTECHVTLRSKQMVEAIQFMLTQLLNQ
jgi:hypothetical protein